MTIAPKGRLTSLLAWGLLVGGVALLMTVPQGPPQTALSLGLLPAAFLFLLAGLVFGLAHPDGRDWASAVFMGWVPVIAGLVGLARGSGDAVAWLVLMVLPGALAAVGAGAGARFARRRRDSA